MSSLPTTGKIVRGPATSALGGVPIFQGRSGAQVVNNSNLSIDEMGDLVPRRTDQTLGIPSNPFSNVYLADHTRPLYEEGTFTPALSCPVSPGTLSISYTCQVGTYRRIANMVYVNVQIAITTIVLNGASGDAFFENFPFAAQFGCALDVDYTLINTPGGTINSCLTIQKGGTTGIMTFNQDATDNINLLISNLSAGDSVLISGSYSVE